MSVSTDWIRAREGREIEEGVTLSARESWVFVLSITSKQSLRVGEEIISRTLRSKAGSGG